MAAIFHISTVRFEEYGELVQSCNVDLRSNVVISLVTACIENIVGRRWPLI